MAFSKITAVSMGTGAAGVGSVGIVGWQLLSLGSSSATPSYSLNNISLKDDPREITFSEYGCFKKMFTGVSISKKKLGNATPLGNLVSPSASVKDKNNPIGCMVMKMSHDLERLQWILSGEVVLKGDNIAWVVWAEGFGKLGGDGEEESTRSDDFQQSLEYRLVLLEKKESGDSWDVKTGYSWKDQGISAANPYYDLNIYVSVPSGKEWVQENKKNGDLQDRVDKMTTTPQNPSNHEYSGIWEYTGQEEDKGPFQEIKISAAPGKEEFLGKNEDPAVKWSGNCKDDCRIYFPADQKWKTYSQNKELDLSNNLSDWYKPFKDKKGKWKSLSEYCSGTNSSGRSEDFCDVA